ncbi:hypothetical protein [Hamadaea tsunoensis]|uniref:hypothetical protein n=1 Tax=Hamadaea tsunoensis TaxID=53368 RepID=UPI0003F7EE68|nr:hypothetical protein [Hamadaea tsunoensis]
MPDGTSARLTPAGLRPAPIAPAVLARTLAQGRLLGVAQIAWATGPFRVRHATDANGNPMLLCRTGSGLAQALMPRTGATGTGAAAVDDVAVVVCVEAVDERVRVWISGWAHPIHGIALKQAAIEFAEVNPLGDLLDVGGAFELHHLDVAEVRLERDGELIDVDVDAYAAAVPL